MLDPLEQRTSIPASFADGDLNALSHMLHFPEAPGRQGWKVSALFTCSEVAALLSLSWKPVPMSPPFGALPVRCLVLDRDVV